MIASDWEKETLALIHDTENEKVQAERRVEVAKRAVQAKTEEIASLYSLLDRYRRKHGLPIPTIDRSPVVEAEYATLTPGGIVDLWADKHDGTVVAKDLTRTVLAAGIYKSYRQASATIYSTVKRRKGYIKVGPGVFQREQQASISHNGHQNTLLPIDNA